MICTTCRARLRVRDRRLVGQIVPCPKCGSMVLIDPPAVAAPSLDANHPSDSPAAEIVTRVPRSDSFDNIDRLLDEPWRRPVARRAIESRWRQPSSGRAPNVTGDPELTGAEAPGSGRPMSPSQPVDEPVPTSEMANPAPPSPFRSIALIGGGVVVGIAMAVGFVGWMLTSNRSLPSPTGTSTLGSPVRDDDPIASVAGPLDLSKSHQETLIPASSDAGDESLELTRPVDSEVGQDTVSTQKQAARGADTDQDLAVQVAEEPEGLPEPIGDVAAATDRVASMGSHSNDAAPALTNEGPRDQSLNELAGQQLTDSAPTEVFTSDDELASFARWLQDAESSQPATSKKEVDQPIANSPAPSIWQPEEGLVQPTRSPPRPVEVSARLEEPISGLQFKDVSLCQALRTLTDLSTIPIRLDPDALGRRNLRADRRVNALIKNGTIRDSLVETLAKTGLSYRIDEGQLTVTTRPEAAGQWVTIRHDVSDLCQQDPARVVALAEWIKQLIAYGTWEGHATVNDPEVAQAGRVSVEDSTLVVEHSDLVQYRVLVFCERLRAARGLATRTSVYPDRISFETRDASFRAWEDPVTVRIWNDSSLTQIVSRIESQVAAEILIDWPALDAAGWSPQDRCTFSCDGQPLREVLGLLLKDKGLAYRVIDGQTVEITTVPAILAQHEVVFYRLGSAASAEAANWIGQQIVQRLGPARVQPDGDGAVAYDAASQTLIVSASQLEQEQVGQIITRWRNQGLAQSESSP